MQHRKKKNNLKFFIIKIKAGIKYPCLFYSTHFLKIKFQVDDFRLMHIPNSSFYKKTVLLLLPVEIPHVHVYRKVV